MRTVRRSAGGYACLATNAQCRVEEQTHRFGWQGLFLACISAAATLVTALAAPAAVVPRKKLRLVRPMVYALKQLQCCVAGD
jgi:hypothetical protein